MRVLLSLVEKETQVSLTITDIGNQAKPKQTQNSIRRSRSIENCSNAKQRKNCIGPINASNLFVLKEITMVRMPTIEIIIILYSSFIFVVKKITLFKNI